MTSAPILDNCNDLVLIAGGRVDKKQQGPPVNEVIDIHDPYSKCDYLEGKTNAFNNYGMAGGLLGPQAAPLICGGLPTLTLAEESSQKVVAERV